MADTLKTRKLFEEFPPLSTEHWEQKIHEDLKGSDYDKKLVWNTPEGFRVRPYYREEHLRDKTYLESLPGEYPFVRGNKKNSNDWEIRQDIRLDNIKTANHKSLFVLDRGITSLGFITPPYHGTSLLKTQKDLEDLLKDIYFDCIQINFVCGFNAPHILKLLKDEVELKKIAKDRVLGAVDYDPLGYLTILGNFGTNEKTDFYELQVLIRFAEIYIPRYKVLGINGYFFANAGATVVQELGYSLAMAAEYLTRLTDEGLTADAICKRMQFNLGVGSSYFMEIAKFRAARYLWAKLFEAYGPKDPVSLKADIHAIITEWNQTIYDPYMNILRATTESMAAVLGGADSLTVRPYTFNFKPTTKFSGRLARNIQIILKEEAHLNKVVDPGAGSYYIENLTALVIEEAWNLFLKVEEEGGYLECLKKGIIQTDIEATAKNRRHLLATKREVLLGTNQFADPMESVQDEIVEDMVFPEPAPGETLVKPIRKVRGAMDFEKLRLSVEKFGKRPRVFLLTYGNPAMRKARSAFSFNFFASGGYEIIDNPGFSSAEEGVKEALAHRSDIVVVCSSDEEYTDFVPQVSTLLGDRAILVVAGAPSCMEDLKKIGINDFIHMRSNILESLKEFHQKLGITLL